MPFSTSALLSWRCLRSWFLPWPRLYGPFLILKAKVGRQNKEIEQYTKLQVEHERTVEQYKQLYVSRPSWILLFRLLSS